jgi:prepilin-type N-terminal cleavage/methylation domain-containing protein
MAIRLSNQNSFRGFTLIELLLAIAIFSIVLIAMNTVFYAALRLRNNTAEAFDQAVPLQRAVTVMQHDLANLVAPGGTLAGPLQSTPIYGVSQSTQAGQTSQSSSSSSQTTIGSAATMMPVPGAIQSSPFFFTSTGVISDSMPWADIQQVSYVLMQPTNRVPGKSLIRCATRNLLPAAAPEPPAQEWLLDGVQDITFLYYDGTQWENFWDTTQTTNTLPLAIKVQLQLVTPPGQMVAQSPIELVVPVDVRARTNQTSQTSTTGSGG